MLSIKIEVISIKSKACRNSVFIGAYETTKYI